MKRLFFLLTVALALAVPLSAHAGPKMTMTDTRLVFDKPFVEGDVIRAVFEFVNDGDAELVIERVTPG